MVKYMYIFICVYVIYIYDVIGSDKLNFETSLSLGEIKKKKSKQEYRR